VKWINDSSVIECLAETYIIQVEIKMMLSVTDKKEYKTTIKNIG
jgi:hypothetical protein